MAHNVEPMDIDNIEGDFDNKENNFHHSNVLPRTPCTEKGYEELDVSELNMKLRYSITPASSPMSKSYTAHSLDNRNSECLDNTSNSIENNAHLTRSFNSMLTKNDSLSKSSKLQPLLLHANDISLDNNRNTSVLRPLDGTITDDGNNITVTVTGVLDIDDNLSLPSTSSSALHTPEATTPTKEIPKNDAGSPIMRGLKSVLNMFRASQSPIPPGENEDSLAKHDICSPVDVVSSTAPSDMSQLALASTPISARRQRESSSKRGSPLKDSIVFNEDLEKELLWKDETTILFSEEKIPIHKLFFQSKPLQKEPEDPIAAPVGDGFNDTVEFMDVSYNDSMRNKTLSELAPTVGESDGEFVDCETTFTQHSDDDQVTENKEKTDTAITDVSEHSQTLNKTAQESQITSEECDNRSLEMTIPKNTCVPDTQVVSEVIDKVIEDPHNNTVSIEVKNIINPEVITPGTEINPESVKQEPDESIQLGDNAVMTSTLMNITQDIIPQNVNDVMKALDETVIVDKEEKSNNNAIHNIQEIKTSAEDIKSIDTSVIESNDKPMSVSAFLMNTTQNITIIEDKNETLNTTIGVEDKPVSASMFIMNATQNIEPLLTAENKPNVTEYEIPISSSTSNMNLTQIINPPKLESGDELINTTVTVKADDMLDTDVNSITQVIEIQSNKNPLDASLLASTGDTPVSSSTFIMNTSQAHLGTGNKIEVLDNTVTLDLSNIASSTFIKDSTQIIESNMSGENIQVPLNNTVVLDLKEADLAVSSSTFVKDIQDMENKSLDVTIVTDPIQTQISSSTFTKDLTQDVEICADTTLSVNKSVDSTVETKDVTQLVLDFQVEDFVEKGFEINSVEDGKTEKSCEDFMFPPDSAIETKSQDISKPSEAILPVATPASAIPAVINDDKQIKMDSSIVLEKEVSVKMECNADFSPGVNPPKELQEHEIKQILNDAVDLKEIVSEHDVEIQSLNPYLLNNSNNAVQLEINELEINVPDTQNIVDKVSEPLSEDKGGAETLPANIPLPDEDDIEIEPLSPVQLADINNASNSVVLPDVINDLDSSKIQDANRIDEVPINSTDHIEAPADLITDTLNMKVEELDKNIINAENICSIELTNNVSTNDNLSNNVESVVSVAHLTDPTSLLDNLKKNNEEEIAASGVLESKTEKSESMDISYDTHDTSAQEGHIIAECHNATKTVHDQIKPYDINETNVKLDVKVDDVISLDAKNDTDIEVQQNAIEDMDIDIHTGSSFIAKENKITESLSVPKSRNDVENKNELIHEELIQSENNSPYVLISVDKITDNKIDSFEEDFEKIENPFASKSTISATAPSSPPIASKGYNFNFDEIDDPFATKIKIRSSPPLDSPKPANRPEEKKQLPRNEPVNKNNRNIRKSYPVRPKSVVSKKNFNNTFDGSSSETVKESSELLKKENTPKISPVSNLNTTKCFPEDSKVVQENIDTVVQENIDKVLQENIENVVEKSELENNTDIACKPIDSVEQNEVTSLEDMSPIASTTPSSSDQSVYLSAATSSGESITVKNVFNLPEIDDMNFNPFATKTKIRSSPPPSLEIDEVIMNPTQLDSLNTTAIFQGNVPENANVEDNVHVAHKLSQQNKSLPEEKDSSNVSNTTCSSKDDKETTVREVHTDDEDTVEGPFLEAEDNEMKEFNIQSDIKSNKGADLGLPNDMMEFSGLPAQDTDDNELFIDAAAYEFLLNQNQSNVVVDSGKESLFLKFDPLFAKRLSSEGIAAALSKIQKRQSTPKKMTKPPQAANTEPAIAGPSTSKVSPLQPNTTEDVTEDLNITTSKPMMVVTPAVHPTVTPRKPSTPTSSNRRSITFTSPAMAVIDRLLSLSANNSILDQNTTITQVSREQTEAEQALPQIRQLSAEKDISIHNLRSENKELLHKLEIAESKFAVLLKEQEERMKNIDYLTNKLTETTQMNKNMAPVVEEYERTIASLITEKGQDKKQRDEERELLIRDRDEQAAHLASMEVSFSDLHSKYEKSKQIILSCKANEDTYKKSIKAFEENLTKMQNNYEMLKQHATSKLNHANQELEKMNKAHESEVLKLNAMIKRKELHITSLEETLAMKTKANEELTAICDELINKVG